MTRRAVAAAPIVKQRQPASLLLAELHLAIQIIIELAVVRMKARVFQFEAFDRVESLLESFVSIVKDPLPEDRSKVVRIRSPLQT